MSESRFVELRGQRIEITDARRRAILEEMPEIAWIANEELRAGVVDAWAAAVASSSLERIGDMKPSGNFDRARSGTGPRRITSAR